MLRSVHEKHERHEKISAVGCSPTVSYPTFIIILSIGPACSERCQLDLPGFTTAMDGSSKNLEGLPIGLFLA